MRLALLSFFLAWPGMALGQTSDALTLKADTVTVRVARTVYDDREAIKSFPFTVSAPANAIRPTWTLPAGVAWTSKTRTLTVTSAPKGELKIEAEWSTVDFDKKEFKDTAASLTVLIGVEPPAPPLPPVPPIPPTPVPVASFRVILVYESGDTLTSAQKAVVYGKAVEDFLNANCTGGKNGWRRRDKDMPGENDPSMAAVWNAIKAEFAPPKSTKTPAVAVQVNERIEIIPVASTPAEMVATLKKYSEGR